MYQVQTRSSLKLTCSDLILEISLDAVRCYYCICLGALLARMCVSAPRAGTLKGLKRSQSPEAEVTDGCEPTCGSWELNLGPREEQPVFLTRVTLADLS